MTLLINHDVNLNNTWFVSELKIADMLNALNVRSDTESNCIPSSFLKTCKSELIKRLFYLFYLSLSTSIFLIFGKNHLLHKFINLVTKIMYVINFQLLNYPLFLNYLRQSLQKD